MRNDHKMVKLNYVLEHYNVILNPHQFTYIHINSQRLSLEAYLKTDKYA